jgi:hypothetical protein
MGDEQMRSLCLLILSGCCARALENTDGVPNDRHDAPMNRRLLLLLLFVCGALLVAATPWLRSLAVPRFTEEQWQRLERGLTVEEVTRILGCPPGDYTQGRGTYAGFADELHVDFFRLQYTHYWCGHEGAIGLVLDDEGKVSHADFLPGLDPPPPTLWERIWTR